MIRELLESYISKKAEIQELQYKLSHLGEGDSLIGNDTIFDYRKGYPRPQAIIGVDWEKCSRLEARYMAKIATLKAECEEVEQWIENISDSLTRRIFRMYYIDGMTQKKIGEAVHLDKSRVSRKIDDYLKNASKATNATL